jgi:hypothetical protein
MTSILFGVCSTGLFGYGTYNCFKNFSRELEKSRQMKTELETSVVQFDDKTRLVKQGILSLPISSPVYYYAVSKLRLEKDVELRKYSNVNIITGEKTSVYVPIEVENVLKTRVDNFLSDPTFGRPNISQCPQVHYMFRTHQQHAQCDGSYLANLLQERHGIRVMYGGNKDIFELNTTLLNSHVFLLGENVGEKFLYKAVSDNKEDLINKVVSENDESDSYFLGGILCAGGLLFSVTATLAELSNRR